MKKHFKAVLAAISLGTLVGNASIGDTLIENYMYQGVNYNIDYRYSNKRVEVMKLPDGTAYSGNIIIPRIIEYNGEKLAVNDFGGRVFGNTPNLRSLAVYADVSYFPGISGSGIEELTLDYGPEISLNYIYSNPNLKKVSITSSDLIYIDGVDTGVRLEGTDSITFNSKYISINGLRADGYLDFGDAWVYINGSAGYYSYGLVYTGEKLTLPGKLYLTKAALRNGGMSEVELPVLVRNPDINETDYPHYIGDFCFSECKNLKKLIVRDPTPWPAAPEAFFEYPGENKVATDSTLYSQCTLYVPGSAISTYKADPVWGRFQSIEPIESGVGDVIKEESLDNEAPVEYYTVDGRRLATPKAGTLVIRRQGYKTDKIVYK